MGRTIYNGSMERGCWGSLFIMEPWREGGGEQVIMDPWREGGGRTSYNGSMERGRGENKL